MELSEFKAKAAASSGNEDVYELCVEYLRALAKNEGQDAAAKSLEVFILLMN